MNKIKVLIADDHSIVRMGLVALLETVDDIEVVGEAEDGETTIQKAFETKPDVIVMDLMMPDTDGVAATRKILSSQPKTRVLILSTSTVSDDLAAALDAGAAGAITKSAANDRLLSAIRSVAAGECVIAPEIEQLIAEDPPVPKLTTRQSEILHSVTRGLTNADISAQLGISPDMVKEHLTTIFAKIGASNRSEAVAIALRKHLLKI